VLNLDQLEPVYCGDEPVCEDAAVQKWMAPPVSVSCWINSQIVSIRKHPRTQINVLVKISLVTK